MGKLFGTDGIRGVANEYPMTPEMAVKTGRAIAGSIEKKKEKPKIIIGKDTRISGDMVEHALISGICSMGCDVYRAGIIPTPGIAFLTSSMRADYGIVISASHNPFYDNGIKIFGPKGRKLSVDAENELERTILDDKVNGFRRSIQKTGGSLNIKDADKAYLTFLKSALPDGFTLEGMKIIMDCANGATFRVAPNLFRELNADVYPLFIQPNGENINDQCGSQFTETLQKKVLEVKADIGLAFDGDGDRLIAVDETGELLSGDQVIAVLAKDMKERNILRNNIVVTTVMSNLGLKKTLKSLGIKHITAQIGDRHVMEKMVGVGSVLGGEDSGHIIFSGHHTTGDGILTSLKLVETIKNKKMTVSNMKNIMTVYPQILINVDVRNKPDLNRIPEIQEVIKLIEAQLKNKGRVLVRYSGTQLMARIMVEGPTEAETRQYCKKIAVVVKRLIG